MFLKLQENILWKGNQEQPSKEIKKFVHVSNRYRDPMGGTWIRMERSVLVCVTQHLRSRPQLINATYTRGDSRNRKYDLIDQIKILAAILFDYDFSGELIQNLRGAVTSQFNRQIFV